MAGLAALLVWASAVAAPQIEFASVSEARQALGSTDAFVERLSPFDRAARMGSGEPVSERDYLGFVRQAPREWTSEERARVRRAFEQIEPALTALLPDTEAPILLVKSSGAEEGGAAYTRGNAVVLPNLARGDRELQRVLAHEIFHIVSRRRPQLRRSLYGAIGFDHCGEVELPDALAARKITNPDAPINDHCIELDVGDETGWYVPVLFSREPRYDPEQDLAFFEYLTLGMLEVERSGEDGVAEPVESGRGPTVVPMSRVSGFYEQVGRNTQYIIHPEEILAENFALLVLGETDVPSPDVQERVRRVLAGAEDAGR